ncbi:hypothetical protein SAMN05192558_109363 [Actinokineospora alba]|uniref:DUF2304 domain-containing protein n=1 Tax=Actinokineospora alba TaxID=504798 RepID=A0A1H0TBR3_9PSEU|nr:DUF2304 domain-containing protein [Actinokineospora alba]TDP66277.1 hypothetical protein C8E96_1777 [Actinokineospora alba]SDJ20778.1 hypothetical protein SAMN05421871_11112 [Actinokineospora alba]SDP51038.1 hypothetical protein SAMN05192558_109363 [Actinokineospora alba]
MSAYIVALIGSVLILLGIFELLRRRQLSEKYAVLWLVVGVTLLVVTIFPGLLGVLSRAAGVEIASNLLFFVAIVFLVGVALHLSWEVSRLEDETRKLAEDLAILRLDVDEHVKRTTSGPDGKS